MPRARWRRSSAYRAAGPTIWPWRCSASGGTTDTSLTYMHELPRSQIVGAPRMSSASIKPVIFISYSHKDEPEKPGPHDILWLTFVQSHLAPTVKHGTYE